MNAIRPSQRVMQELKVEFFRRGLSQERVGELVGLSSSAVSRRINGTVSPTIDELEALAGAAGASLRIDIQTPAAPVSSSLDDAGATPGLGVAQPATSHTGASAA